MPEWCDECFRLWREYSQASNRHAWLCDAVQVAAMEQQLEKARDMLPKVWAAGEQCHAARKALRLHEEQVHRLTGE